MGYCKIHGEYYGYVCNDCGLAEAELLNTVAAAAHFQNNPGDYDCPHCLYRSLRRNASRCPLCHGEIEVSHWTDVLAREKAEAEREAARLKAKPKRLKLSEYEPPRNVRRRKLRRTVEDRIEGFSARSC